MKVFDANGLNIAGHKVPWTALGALAALLGAFLIWKFNQSSGSDIAAAGTAPSIDMGGSSVFGADQESAIANLSQQLSDLGSRIPTAAPVQVTAQSTSSHPGVSDALYAWRVKQHYGAAALLAPATSKSTNITKTT